MTATPARPAATGPAPTPPGTTRAASSAVPGPAVSSAVPGPAVSSAVPGPSRVEVITVRDACVVLGASLVLDAVDLTVVEGESVAILGANGSGKSTLIKTVLGLHPTRSGRVRLFGHDVTRRRHVPWDRVGYVPQRVGAGSGVPATALEVVRSGLLSPRHPLADRGRRASARAMDALDAVGLAHRAKDHVQIFSGGQAQRVLIARALVRSPQLLLLDEPLAGIDRASRQSLAAILTDLHARGLTLVTVLHEMGELTDVVTRAIVLSEGRIISDGPATGVTPSHHDHARHDELGHDHGEDCEHEHRHGANQPAVHHAPVLSTSAPDRGIVS